MKAKTLADALGISASMVSYIRRGKREPSVDLMVKIEDVLNWPVADQIACRQRGIYGDRLVWHAERKL